MCVCVMEGERRGRKGVKAEGPGRGVGGGGNDTRNEDDGVKSGGVVSKGIKSDGTCDEGVKSELRCDK